MTEQQQPWDDPNVQQALVQSLQTSRQWAMRSDAVAAVEKMHTGAQTLINTQSGLMIKKNRDALYLGYGGSPTFVQFYDSLPKAMGRVSLVQAFDERVAQLFQATADSVAARLKRL